ncbi:DUF4139 domain-containing protein [Mycolicibacter sp. MYC123]|uniref:DUF4139 domain-containing protein n=1 Tax=[Mycobacterium] zoologicum TaxID=2872311 RepID=A0ABU5YS11_9MYCO|nr:MULTISPECIES: DUF4139 domain-containing protein [unclassified Mycolicibacter]MEB3051518.1 DUF4139 domain-containing protein [Mycolicibacter sp. MYC123]MEB3064717.1 DUF4139 domain-containing protein [Mycolicibacter sp. MYC101]
MTKSPKVDRLVLYKHAIAFVGRRGPVDGDFGLTFRRDDMKDVLKSLTVEAAGGTASVGAVSFDTPADPRTELAERNLLLNSGEALVGLFDALRGRAVAVHGATEVHRGEVIGVDDSGERARLLVLRAESGAVALVDLVDARRLDVLETPSQEDLDYLIDRSRAATAGRNCDVTVQIRGAADDVRVSYIIAAPMWRVSYRAIRDGDAVTLIATGIIHNPVDEDLADVEVTLTTGQPISFDIDLYHSRQVQRVVVEESERVAAPRRLGNAIMAAPASAAFSVDAYEASVADVETADRGEYFEYRLASPVSLKRGGAAMVPLVVSPVGAVRREVVWREDRGAAPDIVLAFANNTGVVLEEGPVVVYEQGGYAGEAMLDFTSRGAEVRLAFAKDLAVRCEGYASTQSVTTRIRLAADAVIEEQRCERRHTLRAENDHDGPVDVVFELPVARGHTAVARHGATEAGHDGVWHRFSVAVPGHQTAEATVLETWPVYSEIAYDELEPGQLEEWLADRSLDAATFKALGQVLAHQNTARRLEQERERAREQRDEAYAAQGRIAEQLRVLGTEGAEGQLRARQVGELETLQDRVNGLDAEVRRLRDEADAAQQQASAELQRLIAAGE